MVIEFPEKDREIMKGVIDLHVHAAPDIFRRPFDEVELARQAQGIGYKSILFKSHGVINSDRMLYVRKLVSDIEVFGGVMLNHTVGGINPEAVDAALRWNAKEVWMPSIHSKNHIDFFGVAGYPDLKPTGKVRRSVKKLKGIYILDSKGKLMPEIFEVLDLIANANVILGTCHLSLEETYALVKAAKERGVEKILITHPELDVISIPIEDQIKLADMGAIMEHCFIPIIPLSRNAVYNHQFMAKAIKEVGAERCVMATDLGQFTNPHPIEGMRLFINIMMYYGVSEKEIKIMTKHNPAQLLGLA